ncbi:UNVERIFIED_CONTAM: hypothetical protein Slati_0830100, partial [Sesamum latifolium]
MSIQDNTYGNATRKFDKFYVCFGALKQGFKAGCRTVIGVDGCHLEGPMKCKRVCPMKCRHKL